MLLKAPWILPLCAPPLAEGWLRIENGLITELGSGPAPSDQVCLELENCVLLPGFINAHAHIEFAEGAHPQNSFGRWANSVQQAQENDNSSLFQATWQDNLKSLIRSGCTSIVNHSNRLPESLPLKLPRITQVIELVGSSPQRAAASYQAACAQQLEWLQKATQPFEDLVLSPTSLYAIDPFILDQFLSNRNPNDFLSLHYRESADEQALFAAGKGPLAELVRNRGGSTWLSEPLDYLTEREALGSRTLLVHANYVSEQELQILAQHTASIVHCPGSHQYFQHQRFPLEKISAHKINVALGTDSLASNTSLSMLTELRLFHESYPSLDPHEVLSYATLNGAKALGCDSSRGQLSPGMEADLIALPLPQDKNSSWEDCLSATECCLNLVKGKALYCGPQLDKEATDYFNG